MVCLAVTSLAAQDIDPKLLERARLIHQRVLSLDTHVDINPGNFTAERNYTQRLPSQVNLPKMDEGGLDAVFLIVFVGQGNDFTPEGYARAHAAALEKFDAIHRLTEQIAPERIELALTAADVRRIHASGKKVALIGIENGYPLGTDLTNVKKFYDRADAICHWPTTVTASSRIRIRESGIASGSIMGFRPWAGRSSPS